MSAKKESKLMKLLFVTSAFSMRKKQECAMRGIGVEMGEETFINIEKYFYMNVHIFRPFPLDRHFHLERLASFT
jgi:hypothetical protein